jgi:hypothetical protein
MQRGTHPLTRSARRARCSEYVLEGNVNGVAGVASLLRSAFPWLPAAAAQAVNAVYASASAQLIDVSPGAGGSEAWPLVCTPWSPSARRN